MLQGDLSSSHDHRKLRIQMVNKLNAGLSFITAVKEQGNAQSRRSV